MMNFINEDPETNAVVSKVSIDDGRKLLKITSSEPMNLSQRLRWGGVDNTLNDQNPYIVDIPLDKMRVTLGFLLEASLINSEFFSEIHRSIRSRGR